MSRQLTERDAITNLQTYLRAQAFAFPNAPLITVDGIFDNATKNALIDFQLRNGISPSGAADRYTWDLLYSQYLEIMHRLSLPDPIIPFPSYPSNYQISLGEKSFLVATLQYMINEIAVIYNTLAPLEINGVFDEATERSVKALQKINGLAQSGSVDRETWSAAARIYDLSLHYIEQY